MIYTLDELIEQLEKVDKYVERSHRHEDALEYLKQYREMRWHYPSRGELPPNGGDYLVCIEYGDSEYGDRVYIRVGQYFGETGWYTDLGEVYGYWTPIAWMPLPEPPKEEA